MSDFLKIGCDKGSGGGAQRSQSEGDRNSGAAPKCAAGSGKQEKTKSVAQQVISNARERPKTLKVRASVEGKVSKKRHAVTDQKKTKEKKGLFSGI